MCAFDPSSDACTSQSISAMICHIDALYANSPVAVCVRNQRNGLLFSNTSFQQLSGHFKASSNSNPFLRPYEELTYIFLQMEMECIQLGEGCVQNKIFPYGDNNFHIRMECLKKDDEDICVLWQLDNIISSPLANRNRQRLDVATDTLIDKVFLDISEINLLPLSFYVLKFSYSEISSFLSIPEKVIKKRIERAKIKISNSYPSFSDFLIDCYRTKKIYFFIENVSEYIMLKDC